MFLLTTLNKRYKEDIVFWLITQISGNPAFHVSELGPSLYLEQAFRRSTMHLSHTKLMAEALYHQQDPEFVLRLLRAGLTPSCLYLWPIVVIVGRFV